MMMMLDTNVVIDIRERDPSWHGWSLRRLAEARTVGEASVSAVVIGELAMGGGSLEETLRLVHAYGLVIEPLETSGSYRAGIAHRSYRLAGGSRERLLADFLIGGHATSLGAILITRDPRRYRTYFPDLNLITPESHP